MKRYEKISRLRSWAESRIELNFHDAMRRKPKKEGRFGRNNLKHALYDHDILELASWLESDLDPREQQSYGNYHYAGGNP